MWVLTVFASLPALPCCFIWGSSRDIVRGLRPVLLCVPLLNEIWPLLCNSSPPSALLSVNCIADGGSGVFPSDDQAHLMKHAGRCCMFHCVITADCSPSIESCTDIVIDAMMEPEDLLAKTGNCQSSLALSSVVCRATSRHSFCSSVVHLLRHRHNLHML